MPSPRYPAALRGGQYGGGPYLRVQLGWDPVWGKTCRFTGLRLQATAPESFTENFAGVAIYQARLRGNMMGEGSPAPPDPGQWISLVTVPAPPTGTVPTLTEWGIGLLVLALGGMACWRVRSMQARQTA